MKAECTCMCHIDVTDALKNSESTLELKQQISDLREVIGSLDLRDKYMGKRVEELDERLEKKTWQGYEDCRGAVKDLKADFEQADNRYMNVRDQLHVLEKRIEGTESFDKEIAVKWRIDIKSLDELFAKIDKRIEKLEANDIHALPDYCKNVLEQKDMLVKRIERIENHQLQIGVHQDAPEILKRLEALEQSRKAHSQSNTDLFERMVRLEKWSDNADKWMNDKNTSAMKMHYDLVNRIEKLETSLQDLKIYKEPMQQQVWQENINNRLKALESWREGLNQTAIECFGQPEKTKGLTFGEAIIALKQGKRIRRPTWIEHAYDSLEHDSISFCREDLMSNDWEIMNGI